MPITAKTPPPRVYREGGNSTGTFETTAERDYHAYDRLPPRVRRMLQEAPLDFAAETVYRSWIRSQMFMWSDNEFRIWLRKAIQAEYRKVVKGSWEGRALEGTQGVDKPNDGG